MMKPEIRRWLVRGLAVAGIVLVALLVWKLVYSGGEDGRFARGNGRIEATEGKSPRRTDGQAVLAPDAQALALFAYARQPLAHVYDAHGAVGRALAALDAAGFVYGKIEHGTS